ncbi:MAG: Na/Pi cotransporter family protein [Clostridia bacterium]|nr:Na/Pi cotransporter family protein [Clostridia bacterium]
MVHILNLLCGIGLFLYGMTVMSEGTEKAFGDKLKRILSVMTKTKTKSILTGTAVTGVVQSSSVVTVMTVGFVEAGLMNLTQATGIVLGANIGTTVTSLLIAFNFSSVAPLAIFVGGMMKLICKKEKLSRIGEILLGFGLLFLGLNTMGNAFSHLKDNQAFLNFIVESCDGKLRGILTGIIMTAIIQSSSATVGILQSLCAQGLVSTESAIYIVLGQNIGTVFTAMISATGKSKGAKQVGMIHLVFNVVGSVIVAILCEFIPVAGLLKNLESPSIRVSIFHIVFNVITVIMIIPFYDWMIDVSEKMVNFRIIRTGKTAKKKGTL